MRNKILVIGSITVIYVLALVAVVMYQDYEHKANVNKLQSTITQLKREWAREQNAAVTNAHNDALKSVCDSATSAAAAKTATATDKQVANLVCANYEKNKTVTINSGNLELCPIAPVNGQTVVAGTCGDFQ